MELQYTYWQEPDGWYIGYFDDLPDHPTQGETFEELKSMLKDLYSCLGLSKYHKDKLFVA